MCTAMRQKRTARARDSDRLGTRERENEMTGGWAPLVPIETVKAWDPEGWPNVRTALVRTPMRWASRWADDYHLVAWRTQPGDTSLPKIRWTFVYRDNEGEHMRPDGVYLIAWGADPGGLDGTPPEAWSAHHDGTDVMRRLEVHRGRLAAQPRLMWQPGGREQIELMERADAGDLAALAEIEAATRSITPDQYLHS